MKFVLNMSFKQKLKTLLNEASFKEPLDMDQKFERIISQTFSKIRKDNNRQSIVLKSYRNTFSKNHKSKINYEFKKKHFSSDKENYSFNNQRGISPKTAENMLEAFSLLKSEKEDSRSFSNCQFYSLMSKYVNDSNKINQKIKRDIDYFNLENTNSNHNYNICNRPKTIFNKNNSKTNRIILKKIYSKKAKNLVINKDNDKLIFEENINEFKKKLKNDDFIYSRNSLKKYFSKTNNIFNF